MIARRTLRLGGRSESGGKEEKEGGRRGKAVKERIAGEGERGGERRIENTGRRRTLLIGQTNTLWLETCQRANASPEASHRAKVILSVLLSLYPSLSLCQRMLCFFVSSLPAFLNF